MSSFRHVNPFAEHSIDEFKEGALGQPEYHHHLALHPNPNDGYIKLLWNMRDMFYDPHWEVKNVVVSGLKGALFSVNMFAAYSVYMKNVPAFEQKKITTAVYKSPFGILKLGMAHCKPFAVAGFLTGALWNFWWYQVWAYESTKNPFTDHVLGYGIFGTAATILLAHPKQYYLGFFGGCLIGMTAYYVKLGNYHVQRGELGFSVNIGDKTEEERQKQLAKDYIHELSATYQIRYNELREL